MRSAEGAAPSRQVAAQHGGGERDDPDGSAPEQPSSDPSLQAAELMASSLRPFSYLVANSDLFSVLTGLGALYLASALSHALLQPTLELTPIMIWVGVTSLVLFGLRFGLGRWKLSGRRADIAGVIVVALVLLNSLFHIYLLSQSPDTFVNLTLLAVGVTGFLLPMRLVGLVLAITLAFWLAVAAVAGATSAWLHFSFGLFAAVGIRVQLEFRKARLQETNGLLEEALQSAAHEITKRKQVEDALLESQERYALMAAGSNDGLWDWSLRKGSIYVSPRWKVMMGWGLEHEFNTPDDWFQAVHPEDRSDLKQRIYRHLKGSRDHFECEYRILRKDGSRRWMLCRGQVVRDANGKVYRMAGSQTDITRRKMTERQLWRAALHDSLTGLPNRSFFLEQLEAQLHSYKQNNARSFAVLFIDLDRFKVINDSLGHMVGDELLKALSARLKEAVRTTDTVSRFGGDEFAILLSRIQRLSDAIRIAKKVHQKLREPLELEGRRVFTDASIGIVMSRPSYNRPEEMLRDADIAMYQAKTSGKTCHAIFDDDMHANAVRIMQMEHDIRLAFERREFRLHYQPIVGLTTGEINQVEALLRWQHPEKGLLTPGHFLSMAEETGILIPIGWWALEEACRQAKTWRQKFPDRPPVAVSVNLSPGQFAAPDLTEGIARILKSSELAADLLILEITEDATIHIDQKSLERFAELRKMGIRVHLDDFGTGYSSLSYLHRLQFDAAKIDRSFIDRLERGGENHQIVEAMTDLVHNLGMEVVVEGVENASQVALARELGCEYAQGYYFCRPLGAEDLENILLSGLKSKTPIDLVRAMTVVPIQPPDRVEQGQVAQKAVASQA